MFKRMTLLLCFCSAALCLTASSTMAAPLFNFNINNINSGYDSGTSTFTVTIDKSIADASLTRKIAPVGTTSLSHGSWGSADFYLSMALTNIDADSADATGNFSFTDTNSDALGGNFSGSWSNEVFGNLFKGELTNVTFDGSDFNGSTDSVSLAFSGSPQPWIGDLIELDFTGDWFQAGDFSVSASGSVNGQVVPVPVPAAIVLGLFGMGVAAVKLRKHA